MSSIARPRMRASSLNPHPRLRFAAVYNHPPMGQLFLGFRSLLIKLAVFVVLASLLAWVLGGTLWPRPETATVNAVEFGGETWFWQLAVGGPETGRIEWTLMRTTGNGQPTPVDERRWRDVAGPIVNEGGLYFAGVPQSDDATDDATDWTLVRIDRQRNEQSHEMPDRLAVEQQLARARAGLPVQDRATIQRQRDTVVNPPDAEAESNAGSSAGAL